MSSKFNFNANQFEDAFKQTRLGNWEVQHQDSKSRRPRRRQSYTRCMCDARGRLLPHVTTRGLQQPPHPGAWNLPRDLSFTRARPVNPTGRRAWSVLRAEKAQARVDLAMSGRGVNRLQGQDASRQQTRASKGVGARSASWQDNSIKDYVDRYKRLRQLAGDDDCLEKSQ